MDITWAQFLLALAGGAIVYALVSGIVALLISGAIRIAEERRCQFCGGPHDGMTTLCTDDLEESSLLG